MWTLENAKAYLWVFGLNTEAMKAVVKCTSNVKTLREI